MIGFFIYTIVGMIFAVLSSLIVVQFFTDAHTKWDQLDGDNVGMVIAISVFFGVIWPVTIVLGIPSGLIYWITKLRVQARRAAYDRRQTPRP